MKATALGRFLSRGGGRGDRSVPASRARLRVALFLAVGMAMTGFALVAYATNLMRGFENDSLDARFSIRGLQPAPDDVIVVDIDAKTFNDLNTRWERWPRTYHATAIDRLVEAGARGIAYDVQFTEPSGNPDDPNDPRNLEDVALIEAVGRAGSVVLATTEVDEEGRTNVFGGEEVLRQYNARAANAALPPDQGGVIRRIPFEVEKLETFAVAASEAALGHQLRPPKGGDAWIDFRGPPGTIDTVSFVNLVNKTLPASAFRGKIVIVGSSAPSLHDVHPTPTARDQLMSGPELQANAIWTVLHGYPLQSVPEWLVLTLIVAFGFLAPVASLRLRFVMTILLAVTVGVAFTVATQAAFEQGWVLPFIYPLAALLLSTIGAVGTHYSIAAFERERVRDVFSRFVPEQVVSQVLARTDRDLRLGGEDVVGSLMFTDLRGFTSFSENIEASQAIDVVNVYLEEMTEAVLGNGGTLISYAGDGIMAVFGAPIEQPDHADRAVATAKEMIETRLPRFNTHLQEQGLGEGFRMGIGIHSGAFVAGNVGSERRLEYTIIGDTVNAASRIEGLTKGTRHMCLFSEATKVLMQNPPEDDIVFYEDHAIRGRQSDDRALLARVDLRSGRRACGGSRSRRRRRRAGRGARGGFAPRTRCPRRRPGIVPL